MTRETELTKSVQEIMGMVRTTAADATLNDAEVRRILSFVSQVIQVVEQAFHDVLTLMLDIQYMDQSGLNSSRLHELRKRVDLLTARSYYRDAAEICSRLKHLRENFDEFIRPSVSRLQGFDDWRGIFWLIEEREGRIIRLIESAAHEIGHLLDEANAGRVAIARSTATDKVEELRGLLGELHNLNGRILGLSGRAGYLELTQNRNQLRQEVNFMIDDRDQSISYGPRVSVGNGNEFQREFIVAGSIQDSFNHAQQASDKDLRINLESLCKQFEQLSQTMPRDVADQVTQDLSTFVM